MKKKLKRCFLQVIIESRYKFLLGGIGEREIPDPFPNSEVKPLIADGTAHKSVGE